jgi:ABC-type transport system involved in multi-copper enzyme maturation permease subunit
MFRLFVFKELRSTLSSAKFVASFAVCSILILLTFYAGARNHVAAMQQYEAARRENLRAFEGLTDWFKVQDNRIFLPPQPLAALVNGVANDIGRTTEVQGRGTPTDDNSRYNDEPLFAIFRFLDLDFIFQIVLSLFAIVLAYDSINGEKEQGTLRLTFANPVPRATYILGKLTGSFLALGVPLLLSILVGCLLLPSFGLTLSADEWLRLTVIIACGFMYFALFLGASIFVSATTHRSTQSFLVMLVIWICAVMILPRAAVLLAGRAVDVPSVDEISARKTRLSSQLWTEDRSKMSAFKPEPGGDPESMMRLFNEFMQKLGDEREARMNELSSRLEENRNNMLLQRQKIAFGLSRLSPAASLSLAVTALAGTSPQLRDHFLEATRAYQREFAEFMKKKTGMLTGGRMVVLRQVVESGEKPKPIDPTEIPAFTYNPMQFSDLAAAALPDIGLLALFNILFFAGAFIAFLRYDVR